jgi:hypothetical protein
MNTNSAWICELSNLSLHKRLIWIIYNMPVFMMSYELSDFYLIGIVLFDEPNQPMMKLTN